MVNVGRGVGPRGTLPEVRLKLRCTSCGNALPAAARFCSHCGSGQPA